MIASAAILVAPQPAGASEDELEITCRSLLQRYVIDCGCITKFLEQHLKPDHADIMLRLWVVAVNGKADRGELAHVHARYGQDAINRAVMEFHAFRDRLRIYCPQGDALGLAD